MRPKKTKGRIFHNFAMKTLFLLMALFTLINSLITAHQPFIDGALSERGKAHIYSPVAVLSIV